MKRLASLLLLLIVWTSKDFMYFDEALSFLNRLPEQSKPSAYIIALNSQRSGFFNGYYTVIYQELQK